MSNHDGDSHDANELQSSGMMWLESYAEHLLAKKPECMDVHIMYISSFFLELHHFISVHIYLYSYTFVSIIIHLN